MSDRRVSRKWPGPRPRHVRVRNPRAEPASLGRVMVIIIPARRRATGGQIADPQGRSTKFGAASPCGWGRAGRSRRRPRPVARRPGPAPGASPAAPARPQPHGPDPLDPKDHAPSTPSQPRARISTRPRRPATVQVGQPRRSPPRLAPMLARPASAPAETSPACVVRSRRPRRTRPATEPIP